MPSDAEQARMQELERRHTARRAARDESLVKANEVRKQNALLKAAIKRKAVDVFSLIAGTIIDEYPDRELAERMEQVVGRWRLNNVLQAVPGIGPSKKVEILSIFGASPSVRLGNLTYARRRELSNLARAAADPGALSAFPLIH